MSRRQAIVSLIPQLPSPKTENFPGDYPSTEEAEYHESFDKLRKGEEQKLDIRHLLFDSHKTKHEIGRASSNPTKGVNAATNNGYFKAPVMSRRHAQIEMFEQPRRIVITDTDSMHGTLLNGKNLMPHKCHQLRNGDIISFGTEVARDGAVHRPKVFKVAIEWPDISQPAPVTPQQFQSNKIKALPSGYGVSGDDLIVSDGEPGDSIDPESNYNMQYSEDEFSAEENSDYPSSAPDDDNHSLICSNDSNDEMEELYDEDEPEEQTMGDEALKTNINNSKVSIDNLMNNGTGAAHNETSTVSVHNYTKSVTREFEQKSIPTAHQGFYQQPGSHSFWDNVLDNSEQRGGNQSTGGHAHNVAHVAKATSTAVSEEYSERSLEAKLAKLRQHHASMGYPKLQANHTANQASSGIATPVAAINNDVHDDSPVVAAEKIRANISRLIADKERIPSETHQNFDYMANEPRYIKPLHLMSPPALSPAPARAVSVVEPTKSRCSINDLVHQTPAQTGATKSHCPITPASLVKPATKMELDSTSRGRKRGHDEYEEDAATEKDAMSEVGSDAESTSTRPDQTKFLSQSFRSLDVVDEDETQRADEPKSATATTSTTDVNERPIKRARVWPQVTAGFALGTLTGAVGLFAALVASAPPA